MRFISILALVLVVFSCSKDKFTTTPQLKYISVNNRTISGTQTLTFKLDLTDKEGDFTSLLGVKRFEPGCPASDFLDTLKFIIPQDFIKTKGTHGEVVVSLDRTNRGQNACFLPGGAIKPDTAVFKFWTRDKAGHVSDTAVSEQIIILNN